MTEGYQATIATDAVRTASGNPSIASLFWYTDRDLAVVDRQEASFGLRRLDGTRKPAWSAYSSAVLEAR